MHTGAPEDLVLDGGLETVFQGEGIVFDRDHGSFHLLTETQGCVELNGEGQHAVWTARALKREGFDVSIENNGCCCSVTVLSPSQSGAGTGEWRVVARGESASVTTVHDLIQKVRSIARDTDRKHDSPAPPVSQHPPD